MINTFISCNNDGFLSFMTKLSSTNNNSNSNIVDDDDDYHNNNNNDNDDDKIRTTMINNVMIFHNIKLNTYLISEKKIEYISIFRSYTNCVCPWGTQRPPFLETVSKASLFYSYKKMLKPSEELFISDFSSLPFSLSHSVT